jgi:hypothetical protein
MKGTITMPKNRKAIVAHALWLLFLALPAVAQVEEARSPHPISREGTIITGQTSLLTEEANVGLIYDDGEADNAIQATSPNVGEWAMQFSGPAGSSRLFGFAVCLQRDVGDPVSGSFGVNVYHDSAGVPGSLIKSYTATVADVTTSLAGKFHVFPLAGLNAIAVPSSFFIGISLDRLENDFYLCLDNDGVAGQRAIYRSVNFGPWVNYSNVNPEARALMVRAALETDSEPPGETMCEAGQNEVSLLNGRFVVDVCWRTQAGNEGVGKLANKQGTGATLWFFNPDNPEIFLKVRDACVDPFNRYWVFAAGLTNVEVTITVTDTVAAVSKTYVNPLGSAFESVQDTTTFATCP